MSKYLDENGDLYLPMLPAGCFERVTISTNGARVRVAKLNGQWYAMTYVSQNPAAMRNREERATWARAVGLTAKDVETHVRRTKARKAKETMLADIEHAKHVLRAAGYEVTE